MKKLVLFITILLAVSLSLSASGQLFTLGFFTNEIRPEGFILKRTKSLSLVSADTSFKALRKISKRLFFRAQNGENQ